MGDSSRWPGAFEMVRLPTLEVFALENAGALQTVGRSLTLDERAKARQMFGYSICYEPIRVISAPVVNAPTTLGNYIRVRPSATLTLNTEILMHELTHVWQFQTRGMRYLTNSICHQVAAISDSGGRDAAYRLTAADIASAKELDHLPAEQQAMLVEYWFVGASIPLSAQNVGMQTAKSSRIAIRNIAEAKMMVAQLRAARPLPLGFALEEAAWGTTMTSRRTQPPTSYDADEVPLMRFPF
jgi:hypothetical protein